MCNFFRNYCVKSSKPTTRFAYKFVIAKLFAGSINGPLPPAKKAKTAMHQAVEQMSVIKHLNHGQVDAFDVHDQEDAQQLLGNADLPTALVRRKTIVNQRMIGKLLVSRCGNLCFADVQQIQLKVVDDLNEIKAEIKALKQSAGSSPASPTKAGLDKATVTNLHETAMYNFDVVQAAKAKKKVIGSKTPASLEKAKVTLLSATQRLTSTKFLELAAGKLRVANLTGEQLHELTQQVCQPTVESCLIFFLFWIVEI
jgi:hypothetical protein